MTKLSIILAYWSYLSTASTDCPDWGLFSTARTPTYLAVIE
ncbi:MAG TPA: hypothetical protein V6D50_23515 [Chroococcales cyanobacterium]